MGLFKKMKDILFEDDEEYTSQIKITPEMRNETVSVSEEKTAPKVEEVQIKRVEVTPEVPKPEKTEREIYKSEPNFPFLDFDEAEFERGKDLSVNAEIRREVSARHPNAYEYERERKKRIDRRPDYRGHDRSDISEPVERKKFKPSPIISPVYGFLNKNYKSEDIIKREIADHVDIQAVRNKAFGEKKEEIKTSTLNPIYKDEVPKTTVVSEPKRKVKTIDELLEETSDITVEIERNLQKPATYEEPVYEKPVYKEPVYKEPVYREPVVSSYEKPIESINPRIDEKEEDTLENDLFDLIDSMYDSSEDGE